MIRITVKRALILLEVLAVALVIFFFVDRASCLYCHASTETINKLSSDIARIQGHSILKAKTLLATLRNSLEYKNKTYANYGQNQLFIGNLDHYSVNNGVMSIKNLKYSPLPRGKKVGIPDSFVDKNTFYYDDVYMRYDEGHNVGEHLRLIIMTNVFDERNYIIGTLSLSLEIKLDKALEALQDKKVYYMIFSDKDSILSVLANSHFSERAGAFIREYSADLSECSSSGIVATNVGGSFTDRYVMALIKLNYCDSCYAVVGTKFPHYSAILPQLFHTTEHMMPILLSLFIVAMLGVLHVFLLKPICAVINSANSIEEADNNENYRIPITNNHELDDVMDVFRKYVLLKNDLKYYNNIVKLFEYRYNILHDSKHGIVEELQHNFRTPLHHISSAVSVLSNDKLLAENQYMQIIEESCKTLTAELNTSLSFDKSIFRNTTMGEMEIKLIDLIDSIETIFRPYSFQNNISIMTNIQPDIYLSNIDVFLIQEYLFSLLRYISHSRSGISLELYAYLREG